MNVMMGLLCSELGAAVWILYSFDPAAQMLMSLQVILVNGSSHSLCFIGYVTLLIRRDTVKGKRMLGIIFPVVTEFESSLKIV
jgi:hypothetical protein